MKVNTKQTQEIITSLLYHIGLLDRKPKDMISPWSGYVGLYVKNRGRQKWPPILLQMTRISFPSVKKSNSLKAAKAKDSVDSSALEANVSTTKGIFFNEKRIMVVLDWYIIIVTNDDVFSDGALQSLAFRIALLVWEFDLVMLNTQQNNVEIVRKFFQEMKITDLGIIRLFHDAPKSWKSRTEKQLTDADKREYFH